MIRMFHRKRSDDVSIWGWLLVLLGYAMLFGSALADEIPLLYIINYAVSGTCLFIIVTMILYYRKNN